MAISTIYNARTAADAATKVITVEIAANASGSDRIKCPSGMKPTGVTVLGAWTAADLAFKVASTEAGTLLGPIKGSGGSGYLKCAVAADVPVALPAGDVITWPYFQLLSCTANNAADVTPVNQTAKRTIEVVLSRFLS